MFVINRLVDMTVKLRAYRASVWRTATGPSLIEGTRESIDSLVAAIAAGARNTGLLILWRDVISERDFGSCHMGFRKVAELPEEDRANFSSILENAAMDQEFRNKKAVRIRCFSSRESVCANSRSRFPPSAQTKFRT
jgi:hypothetical protein